MTERELLSLIRKQLVEEKKTGTIVSAEEKKQLLDSVQHSELKCRPTYTENVLPSEHFSSSYQRQYVYESRKTR